MSLAAPLTRCLLAQFKKQGCTLTVRTQPNNIQPRSHRKPGVPLSTFFCSLYACTSAAPMILPCTNL